MTKHYKMKLRLLILLVLGSGLLIVQAQAECEADEWLIDGNCTTLDTTLDEGWHAIEPGGDTRCAHDTDYQFWVRPGNDDVVLYFQGGGGCWNQDTCRMGSSFYKQVASTNEPVSYHSGIFDFDNPDNPFAGHTMVFAPSCTGDVYMGSGVTDYGDDVVVHHRGFDNLMAAVNFTVDYAPDPDSVFVTGCSAGSVGSAIAIPFVIEAYPDATVAQLGDSLGSIFAEPTDPTVLWGVPDFYTDSLAEFAPDLSEFTTTDYYVALAQAYPNHRFAQFNYQFDFVQQRYFAAGVEDAAQLVSNTLATNLNTIAEAVPNFRYFLADDYKHCILPTAEFYRVEEEGVSVVEWVTAIAENAPIENVSARGED